MQRVGIALPAARIVGTIGDYVFVSRLSVGKETDKHRGCKVISDLQCGADQMPTAARIGDIPKRRGIGHGCFSGASMPATRCCKVPDASPRERHHLCASLFIEMDARKSALALRALQLQNN